MLAALLPLVGAAAPRLRQSGATLVPGGTLTNTDSPLISCHFTMAAACGNGLGEGVQCLAELEQDVSETPCEAFEHQALCDLFRDIGSVVPLCTKSGAVLAERQAEDSSLSLATEDTLAKHATGWRGMRQRRPAVAFSAFNDFAAYQSRSVEARQLDASRVSAAGQSLGNNVGLVGAMRLISPNTVLIPAAQELNYTRKFGSHRAVAFIQPTGDLLHPMSGERASTVDTQSAEAVGVITETVKELGLPTLLVGVGSQIDVLVAMGEPAPDNFKLLPQEQEMLNIVVSSARGQPNVFAHGAFTAALISDVSSSTVAPLGCPSLLLNALPSLGIVLEGKRAALQATMLEDEPERRRLRLALTLPDEAAFFRTPEATASWSRMYLSLARQAPDHFFVLQDDQDSQVIDTLAMQGLDVHPDQVRSFGDVDVWEQHLENRDLVIGARIHGSMMAHYAGVPALLVAVDMRQLEFARAMHIPHVARTDPAFQELVAADDFDIPAFLSLPQLRFNGTAFDELRAGVARQYSQSLESLGVQPNPLVDGLWQDVPQPQGTSLADSDARPPMQELSEDINRPEQSLRPSERSALLTVIKTSMSGHVSDYGPAAKAALTIIYAEQLDCPLPDCVIAIEVAAGVAAESSDEAQYRAALHAMRQREARESAAAAALVSRASGVAVTRAPEPAADDGPPTESPSSPDPLLGKLREVLTPKDTVTVTVTVIDRRTEATSPKHLSTEALNEALARDRGSSFLTTVQVRSVAQPVTWWTHHEDEFPTTYHEDELRDKKANGDDEEGHQSSRFDEQGSGSGSGFEQGSGDSFQDQDVASWEKTAVAYEARSPARARRPAEAGADQAAPTPLADEQNRTRFLAFDACGAMVNARLSLLDGLLIGHLLGLTVLLPQLALNGTQQVANGTKLVDDMVPFSEFYDVNATAQRLAAIVSVQEAPPGGPGVRLGGNVVEPAAADYESVERLLDATRGASGVRLGCSFGRLRRATRLSHQQTYWQIDAALTPAAHITRTVEAIERSIRERSEVSGGGGRFTALHLRAEPDWVAHCKVWEAANEGSDPPVKNCMSNTEQLQNVFNIEQVNATLPIYVATELTLSSTEALDPLRDAFSMVSKWTVGQSPILTEQQRGSRELLALVDMEVCRRADRFIGNSVSNFSAWLLVQRAQQDRRVDRLTGAPVDSESWPRDPRRDFHYNGGRVPLLATLFGTHVSLLPERPLKWVFTLTEAGSTSVDLEMARVAVLSAQRDTDLQPVCVFDGDRDHEIVRWLTARGVPVVHHTPAWLRQLRVAARKRWLAAASVSNLVTEEESAMLARWLRVDVPTLGFVDEHILFADVNSMFAGNLGLRDFEPLPSQVKHLCYVAGAEESHSQTQLALQSALDGKTSIDYANADVMLMHVERLRVTHQLFVDWAFNDEHMDAGLNFAPYGQQEQGAYNEFYQGLFQVRAEPLFAWKAQWGAPSSAAAGGGAGGPKLIRFAGPKPRQYAAYAVHLDPRPGENDSWVPPSEPTLDTIRSCYKDAACERFVVQWHELSDTISYPAESRAFARAGHYRRHLASR